MTVSLTLFRWVALYSSISCLAEGAITDRVHIGDVVPSSRAEVSIDDAGTVAVWHAATTNDAQARAATLHARRDSDRHCSQAHPGINADVRPSAYQQRFREIRQVLTFTRRGQRP